MLPFSFYKKGITNKIPNLDITLERAVELIKSDTYKADIERLRNSDNKSVREVVKKGLDYFTFSGTFKKRLTDSLIKHSGLICLDFDHLEDVERTKAALSGLPYVSVCFISPSGDGLKVVIPINGNFHAEAFRALEIEFLAKYVTPLDKSGKDVTRACFVSWDPDIYYNPNAEEFKFEVPEEPQKQEYTGKKSVSTEGLPASKKFERDKHLARIQ